MILDIKDKKSGAEIAKKEKIKAIAIKKGDELLDLNSEVEGKIELISRSSKDGLHILRHSTAHLLAQAVQNIFPKVKKAIGPATDNGFFYDFDNDDKFTDEDLKKIEKEMKRICKSAIPIKREVILTKDAIKLFENLGEIYKVEILKGIESKEVTIYRQGDFVDLCRGPHVSNTSALKAFKLKNLSGAYWKHDKNNKMLQRVYGYAFDTEESLQEYLTFLKEVEKRDHRKLGKDLDLFTTDKNSVGSTFWLPKGMALRRIVENVSREEHIKAGYEEVKTPTIMNRNLWEISGHWENYRDNMYTTEAEEEVMAIKPMNCPGGTLVYKNSIRSYKDLPLKFYELGNVFRKELSGTIHGLMRQREFTQDDAHIFLTEDMIEGEIVKVIELVDKIFKKFGFEYSISLSTKPDKYIGSDEVWERATLSLKNALENRGMEYEINEGDGSFYGPKIDYKVKDAIGRVWQCSTIQLDFNLPERFNLEYIGKDNKKHRPIMVHRAIYGSLERFIGILVEHYAGSFPIWLSPVQVKILTISDKSEEYAKEIFDKLKDRGVRVEVDLSSNKIGQKIRKSSMNKIPLQVVIGEEEVSKKMLNVRVRGEQESKNITVEELLKIIEE